MLRLFYNKEKDGREYPWKIFDPLLSKMYRGTHVDIQIPGKTEERCTVGGCAAFCMYYDGKVLEHENGILSIVERPDEERFDPPVGVVIKACNE